MKYLRHAVDVEVFFMLRQAKVTAGVGCKHFFVHILKSLHKEDLTHWFLVVTGSSLQAHTGCDAL